MRKTSILLFLLIIILILTPKPTYADMFSKPTAEIHVIGVDQPYQLEILVFYDGFAEILELDQFEYRLEGHYASNYPIDLLNGYQDSDGFVARTIYNRGAPDNLFQISAHVYKVGYYSAPRVFKVLLILEGDVMISSPVIHRNLFHSEIVYDLSDAELNSSSINIGQIVEIIPYTDYGVKYLLRVFLTIVIELVVLLAFMYKQKRTFIIVGVANFVTQSILTIGLIIGFYFWAAEVGLVLTLLLGEFIVFTTEMFVYYKTLDEQSKKRALIYGFAANLVTFSISIYTLGFI